MALKKEANRTVQLTEAGLKRLQAIRRRYKTPLDDLDCPSVNTMKRTLGQGAVFRSTLERVWEYFGRCAAENGETLPPPVEGRDFIEAATVRPETPKEKPLKKDEYTGWISRRVPSPNRLFTGRHDVLERLNTALSAGPAALIADPQALTGLGGIGKTQTALAYLYRYRRDYSRVFWVSAETIEMLNDGLAGIAEELRLPSAGVSAKHQALAAMHDWFRNQSGWLLVMDNADDIETLAPHFPRHHAGHLLVTTRAENTVKWAAPVRLTRLSLEEGTLLLLRRAGLLGMSQALSEAPREAVQAARTLCEEFDGLPLALNQAGAYLAQTSLTVAGYHALYREHGLRHLEETTDPEHASVAATFTLALERLTRRSRNGEAAADLMRLCAFLAPDAIPEVILAGFCASQESFPASGNLYDEACQAICGYSLAVRNAQTRTLTLHRLVQAVTRENMTAEERRLWAKRAVHAAAEATPDFEFEDWPLCDQLLPQWRLCGEHIDTFKIETAEAASLLYQAGRYHRARASYSGAEVYTVRAVAMAEAVHGREHRITADFLDELACLYRVLDRRDESEALHRRAVAILENASESERHLVGAKLHNMALLYVQYEDYERAEEPFRRALAIYEAQPEPDPLLIAATLTQMAGVYRSAGRFDQAEPHCRRALEIYERVQGPAHIDLATACNNLALLYLTMERYAESEDFYLRALTINEQARGREHPETGTVLWGLARAWWKQRRMAEADAPFQRAVSIYTRHFGPDHARSARLISSYIEFKAEYEKETRLLPEAPPAFEQL